MTHTQMQGVCVACAGVLPGHRAKTVNKNEQWVVQRARGAGSCLLAGSELCLLACGRALVKLAVKLGVGAHQHERHRRPEADLGLQGRVCDGPVEDWGQGEPERDLHTIDDAAVGARRLAQLGRVRRVRVEETGDQCNSAGNGEG